MWNIYVRAFLLFLPLIFANVSTNDWGRINYGKYAIHACQDSSVSGTAVAMDVSQFTGSYCECILTKVSKKVCSEKNVATVDVIYLEETNIIHFAMDNITYTNTSRNKSHNFNGDFIRVVVKKTHTADKKLRTGNPCMIFRVKGCSITLTCYNGTDIDPRQCEHNSTASSEFENITTKHQQSPRPTVLSLTKTRTVQTTTAQQTTTTLTGSTTTTITTTTTTQPTQKSTDPMKVSTNNFDLSSATLDNMETSTSVIEEFPTQSNKLQSGGTDTVIIIIVAVVVSVVCTACIAVLIACYCKRRKRSPIKSDESTIKPRKKDDYVVTENELYAPFELLSQPSNTQGSTEHIYDQSDIDIIATRAHENKTKPLLQGQETNVSGVNATVKQSDGDDTEINAVANSEKKNQENQNYKPIEQPEQLYTQVNKIK